jgi:Uma2 family endonuclease
MYAPRQHHFTLRDYNRMAEYGIVPERGTELVDGRVVEESGGVPRRFTAGEYMRMAETGILAADARVELIEGEIIDVSPSGSRHAACISRLSALVHGRLGRAGIVRVQLPLELGLRTCPEPDLAVVRHSDDFYASSHPTGRDALLVVEVADSSVAFDRDVKHRVYADQWIPVYWLVDLAREVVVVHTAPAAGRYTSRLTCKRGQTLIPSSVPSLEVTVQEILG